MAPKSFRSGVPGGPGGSEIVKNWVRGALRGSRGVPGGSKALPETQNGSKEPRKKKLGTPPGAIFGDFCSILGCFLGSRGVQNGVQNGVGFQGPKIVEFSLNFHQNPSPKKDTI